MLVLDEADEMLDIGFAEDLEAILEATSKKQQTALFSATIPTRILTIAERHLKESKSGSPSPARRRRGKDPQVRQVAYVVRRAQKPAALNRILEWRIPTPPSCSAGPASRLTRSARR